MFMEGASSSSGAPSGSVAAVTRKKSMNRKPADRPEGSFGVGDEVQRRAAAKMIWKYLQDVRLVNKDLPSLVCPGGLNPSRNIAAIERMISRYINETIMC